MIAVLDHLTLSGSAPAYEILLGRRVADGRLQTGNVGVMLVWERLQLSDGTLARLVTSLAS